MEIIKDINNIKLQSSTIALGFFDGVHKAHVAVIDAAKKYKSDNCKLVVFSFSLGSNPPVGKRNAELITTEEQKIEILKSLGVDIFLEPPFDSIKDMSPNEYIDFLTKNLGAKHLSCGFDYRFGKMASGNPNMLPDCTIVPEIEGISSTNIRTLIKDGKIEEANNLLGRSFALKMPVISGQGLGEQLGFPTANQAFPKGFLVPKYGVYVTKVTLDKKTYKAITNVGIKPTVEVHPLLAETHILGFKEDIYNKVISVEFLHFIRPELKFSTIEELKLQISGDISKVSLYKE